MTKIGGNFVLKRESVRLSCQCNQSNRLKAVTRVQQLVGWLKIEQ